jgi:hemerythrin-like domain-containing protein
VVECPQKTPFSRVLDVLEHQIERLEGGAPIDEPLVSAAAAYLRGFPDECHHPKEDLVYRKLAERDPGAAASLSHLLADHQKLSAAAEGFDHALQGVLAAAGSIGSDQTEPLRNFLRSYRRHMEAEELGFFPAVLGSLDRDDLAELDHELFDRADPLFDPAAEARFAELRREVETRPSGSPPTADRRGNGPSGEEFALLHDLRGVDQFNDAMDGRGFRLLAHRAGGFTLERNGRWLLDVPDCDATRAAWCAYYFVKGASSPLPSPGDAPDRKRR